MELSQLRYVVKLAEIANYSKAANQLYITQPALSQQISALENEIGVKLFERTTRKVALTEVGKEFVERAQSVLREMDELDRIVKLRRREIRSTLSVGLLSTLSHLNIPEYIMGFRQHYPNIQIDIQIGWSSELITMVKTQELDAAVTNVYFSKDKDPDPRLNIIPYFEDKVVVVAARRSRVGDKTYLTMDDLCDLPVIGLDNKTSIRMQMNDIFSTMHRSPKIVCTCPDIDSLMGMVRANIGITFLSSGVARPYLRKDLVSIPLRPIHKTQTAMVTYKRKTSSYALRLFEDYFNGIVH
ncbi:LysR family transcriptional regulator [Murdochiella massiliensis]|uniref:LysR family transcriptional regulator n=1 Tax=Murdochiella massiliensis TaxID=1673723 RepID=UPI00082E8E0E|nr:LysR family transcriptional regulator [Murdochiella massiliensis]